MNRLCFNLIHPWQKKSSFFFFFFGDFIYVFISINQQKHISDFVLFSFYSRKKIAFFSLGFTRDMNFLIFNFWIFYLCMYFYRLTEKQIWSGDKLTTRKKEKNLRFFFFLYSWKKYYFFFFYLVSHMEKKSRFFIIIIMFFTLSWIWKLITIKNDLLPLSVSAINHTPSKL